MPSVTLIPFSDYALERYPITTFLEDTMAKHYLLYLTTYAVMDSDNIMGGT